MMQVLGRYYVQRFNYRYKRTGTLWEGRYKATLIDTEQYVFTCMRYIELNPVRAGLAGRPSDYPWSVYRCNALGDNDNVVKAHQKYNCLGANDEERRAAYQDLFSGHISDKELADIREATNKAWVLGSDRFRVKMEKELSRPVVSSGRGGDRKSKAYRLGAKNHRV